MNMKQGKKCFIITPIGDERTDTFRKAKGVIESVIKPVLQAYGFDDIKPAYEINISGMINTQIINRIIDDDLVIANLTGSENVGPNPNVMYELCLRHVVAKPIIHICENGTPLPFDIKDNRTIFYENDMLGVAELKGNMAKFMDEMVYDIDCMDNPIYTAYKLGKLLKETQDTDAKEILKLLIDISGSLSEMNKEPQITKKYIFPSSGIAEQTIYTAAQFASDVNKIDKDKVCELMNIPGNSSMKIHEVAKYLDTMSKTVLCVAQIIGIESKSAMSSIKSDDIKRMMKYIRIESNE